ncbi:DUF895 domain membrane protein [Podochytrium sp. JEL0797]|nr:DUF895 domain membrane protein [Podochytrium sp. JEL0797]
MQLIDNLAGTFRLNRMRDVAVLGAAFFFMFVAFGVTQNMASTTLPSKEVAFPCLGSLYVSFALSNLFGAAPLVNRLGSRRAMLFGSFVYSVFDLSNVITIGLSGDISSQLAVLMPAAILLGIGASVMWCAEGLYVMKCASKETIGRYSGVFFSIYSLSSFLGPLFTLSLLQANFEKEDVFKVLTGVGLIGPMILGYILTRPEPSNPATVDETPVDTTKSNDASVYLKTYNLIISKKMLVIATAGYLNAFTVGSYSNAVNNFSLLYPIAIINGINDATLQNQSQKLIGSLFPADASAYAGFRFHTAMATGICYFVSRSMLTEHGFPDMGIWVTVLGTMFGIAICSVFVITSAGEWGRKENQEKHEEKITDIEEAGLLKAEEICVEG